MKITADTVVGKKENVLAISNEHQCPLLAKISMQRKKSSAYLVPRYIYEVYKMHGNRWLHWLRR
jgi:hypothetical protein